MLFFNLYNLMWTSTCFAFVCFWSKNKCRLSAAAKQKSTQKKLLTSKGFSGWNSKLFLGVKTVVLGRREAKARMEGRSDAGRWKVFSRWRKKMWKDVTVFFTLFHEGGWSRSDWTKPSQTWCPRGGRPLRLRAEKFWTRSQSFVREDGEASGRLGSGSLLSGCELWCRCTSEKHSPPAGGAPPGFRFADVIHCNVCNNQIGVEPRPSDESPRLKSASAV